jgi:hypothetical protein
MKFHPEKCNVLTISKKRSSSKYNPSLTAVKMLAIFINNYFVKKFVEKVAYVTISSDADAANHQQDLDKLAEWESKWFMKFHPEIQSVAIRKIIRF